MHKGIHNRGYLPHWDFEDSVQAITFRLAEYEDAGCGECLLGIPDHAGIVQSQLVERHGTTYKLIDWCVMPNHVHVLVKLLDDTPLHEVLKRWKAVSAIGINRLRKQSGSIWMVDYHDRFIRDMNHFHNAKAYIHNNPVKAGLCAKPEDWPYSSAGINWSAEFIPPETGRLAE